MAKYIYPAIFECEDNGAYSVYFPDIEGCYTSGGNLTEAFEMATDALTLMLKHYEEENRQMPQATPISNIRCNHLVNYIFAST